MENKKFIVHVVIREASGFRDIPVRGCETYEDAETARKAYERRNPGYHFLVEHKLGEETAEEW